MNRRSFLTNALAGAAAVIGAQAIEAPAAEAAPASDPRVRQALVEYDRHLMTRADLRAILDDTSVAGVADDLYCAPCDKVFHKRANKVTHDDNLHVRDDAALVQGYIDRGEVIPPGKYLLGSTLTVPSGATLQGSGPTTVLHSATGAPVYVTTGTNTTIRDITVGPSAIVGGVIPDEILFIPNQTSWAATPTEPGQEWATFKKVTSST